MSAKGKSETQIMAEIWSSDREKLQAEINALKAELAALKEWRYSDQELAIKILSYLGFSQESSKEPYADRRRDHIAEMICQNCEPLKTELAALKAPPKVLSAEEVKETGAYWWKKIGADDFDEPVQVFEDEHYITHDPILIISRIGCVGGISQELWKGQFIGPIKMPEV